ncbi:GNAT family N-acetyltransferase [Pseudorhodoferax sp.]|uniref:GNAT family N-acetyltransferase n=1 Tax=Pseudorhodoferax sp. TaxID=1993553 RepID=UPI002DD6A5EE|nr:GNAT family N-acetyltransferase [Pseudorhodoferax sp.]
MHLLGLNEQDRYMRFGYAASDAHIGRYVDQIDFEHDEVFGIFNRRLELAAMAHLAYLSPAGNGNEGARVQKSAEFGVSVEPRYRGRGLGARLFEKACLHGRNRGVDTLIIHALSDNAPMLKIARAAGATLERDGPDATAVLKLPPDDLGSHLSQLVGTQAAAVDYGLKVHATQIDRLVRSVRGLLSGAG